MTTLEICLVLDELREGDGAGDIWIRDLREVSLW